MNVSLFQAASALNANARWQDFGFDDGGGERRALEVFDNVEEGVETAARLDYSLPPGDEARENALVYRFNLFSEAS